MTSISPSGLPGKLQDFVPQAAAPITFNKSHEDPLHSRKYRNIGITCGEPTVHIVLSTEKKPPSDTEFVALSGNSKSYSLRDIDFCNLLVKAGFVSVQTISDILKIARANRRSVSFLISWFSLLPKEKVRRINSILDNFEEGTITFVQAVVATNHICLTEASFADAVRLVKPGELHKHVINQFLIQTGSQQSVK